jgi:asparagine synthase (glutamine-hydrolysing)
MCGINGFIKSKNISITSIEKKINAMNVLIEHRGPDDDGIFLEVNESYGIALGMRRLSIIDLSTGKQPIYSDDHQLVIVYNGEIYNYQSIREELVFQGVSFTTHSDTEVILKLYEHSGEASFSKLDGMFAFSIYDKRKQKVFIARDFFGEKPLYYSKLKDGFIWASELKSLVHDMETWPKISKIGLNLYLRLGYIPAPHTIYDGIFKLEANHYMCYDLEKHSFEIRQISPNQKPKKNSISFDDAKQKTKELVLKSVESRSISDVPLGTFLSGGVDSSIISLCLSQLKETKIETFSIGFKKATFDETEKSRLVAGMINSIHHEFIIGEEDLRNSIHEILLNFDEPFSDSAALPTYLVSKKTRDHVKVALTGDGGDEVFGGYNKYYMGKLNSNYTRWVPKPMHHLLKMGLSPLLVTKDDQRGNRFKMNKLLQSVNYDGNYYWDIISLANTQQQLDQLLLENKTEADTFKEYKDKTSIQKPNTLLEFRLVDQILSLEGGMLPKVDRTSMQVSLECRAPFLNRDIWNFTNSLPERYLMKGWNKKYLLKEAFHDQFPEGFLDKGKQGFNIPVGDWLRSSLRLELESFIEVKFLESQEIFKVENVISLVRGHLSGKKDSTYSVWAFYCFQKWYKNCYMPSKVKNQIQ